MKEIILNEIINNTKKLVNFKTIKDNYNEFDKAYEFIKEELKNYNIKEYIINNYKNIVISNTLDPNLDIIFCAHLDVVPCSEYKTKLIGNKLYGRGTIDMKGQLSVIMSLLKNNKTNKKIAFIITSDEEIGGYCCKEILKDYNAKLAVIPDASSNFNLVIEEKGLLQLELSIKGKTAHASEPYKGDNAILKLINIYNKLLEIYPMPSNEEFITTINLSKINGGSATNMVPGEANMTLDIRFNKDDSIDSILNNIKNISKEIEIKILDQGPIFQVNEKLPIIQEFIKNAENILKHKVVIEKCVATSDAIYFSEKNIPTILMNPIGEDWHGPNEHVEINSLYTLYLIFKTLL